MNIVVVGGGAAGMLAAGFAAANGANVTLLEKNERCGRKLLITGKGRCNVTNDATVNELMENVVSNPRFLFSAFNAFNPQDVKLFFEGLGVPLKTERGRRVFPVSDKSYDIVSALLRFMEDNNVKVLTGVSVKSLEHQDGCISGVLTNKGRFDADAVILATGGLSYPKTGSTGDGYRIAKDLGHTVTRLQPSLVALDVTEDVSTLAGLALKNVNVTLYENNRKIAEEFGELLFTHTGLSGPVILSLSAMIDQDKNKNPHLSIDLKPALSEETLDARLLRDFKQYANKDFKNALADLLPKSLIDTVIQRAGIDAQKKVNSVTKDERTALMKTLKGLSFTIKKTAGFDEAVITRGGVSVKEINPKTMASKLINGLYFAGEIIDTDALTGGYNLQIAFSTGYLSALGALGGKI